MADTIFSKIARMPRKGYPQEMLSWITSDAFMKSKQPLYIARSRNVTGSPKGEHIDLRESYERLIKAGLAERYNDLKLTWTKQPNHRRVGYCSVLMKTIIISSIFDSPAIPEFVCDYVLYHELLHIKRGFDPFAQQHDEEFQAEEKLYPKWEEAEGFLKRLKLFT
jgi:predicted metal-dependent hydrolase